MQQSSQALVSKAKSNPKIAKVIAVASGKGGVGKSTTAVNLAFALNTLVDRIGILDADIYGPSVPVMLGNASEQPDSLDGKFMQPLQAHGVYANSIGYLVPPENASIWRGPMASRALQQLYQETLWPKLDYLIVDMPPGTGDIQLTLSQQIPVDGAIIVTTPQDLALADAIKGVAMFQKVDIPVLGVVENMSYHQCENCGHKSYLFSQNGGKRLSEGYEVPLLGKLPLDIQIREHADGGRPLLQAQKDSALSAEYRAIAAQVVSALGE